MGVELIGVSGSLADAEVILLASECLKRLGLKYTLQVNSLKVLKGLLEELDVSGERQSKVIALIDGGKRDEIPKLIGDDTLSKLIEVRSGIKEAEKIIEGFRKPAEALTELSELAVLLDEAGVEYAVDFSIARGLDYYTGMVFEVRVDGLGAQNQICGGGRYDNLVELFGGPATPAVGFAFGFDRVCEAFRMQGGKSPKGRRVVLVAPVGEAANAYALKVSGELRRLLKDSIVSVELDVSGRKLAKVLEYASEKGVDYVVIVGEKEKAEGKVSVRDMGRKTQENVSLTRAAEILLQGAPDLADA
jgi:histidyl-tRNA synthetase